MSDPPSSTVVMFDNSDPEMRRAYEQARFTFRYFWRELAWERRRIVPALDLACIKAPFSDGPGQHRTEGSPEEDGEHPMSLAMVPSFQKGIADDPSLIHSTDERGWTLLHQQALAGSAATVEVWLDAGADVNAVTANGMTPLQLACSLGWVNVASLLTSKGEASSPRR
jgi:hypothetical protein